MEITNNEFNTMPEQVQENKDNIKKLAEYIKPLFNTQTTMATTDVSIDSSDVTDWVDNPDSAFILSANGLLFKYIGQSGSTIVIEYWTTLPQGPQGATGPTGATGPQGPAGTNGTNGLDTLCVISILGFNTVTDIQNLARIGLSWFNRTPNPNEFIYFYGKTTDDDHIYLIRAKISYTDSDYAYVTSVNYEDITGPQGATGPQGPQGPAGASATMYLHKILFLSDYSVSIITSTNTAFTTTTLAQWLYDNGYTSVAKGMVGSGPDLLFIIYSSAGTSVQTKSVSYTNETISIDGTNKQFSKLTGVVGNTTTLVSDTVVQL